MDKQLVIPEEAGVPRENHQPWARNWLFLKKPEYPERSTNHGQLTGYSWGSGVPGENHQPWTSSWLFLKKPEYPERTTNHGQAAGYSWRSRSTQREPPTMDKQLVIPEEAEVHRQNHQPWTRNWLFLKKPEYPERTTNHGQAAGYSWRSRSTQREPPTMDKQLVIPEEAGVPRENHQPWARNWLFLKKRSTQREPPTMGKQLVIPEEDGVHRQNHQPWTRNWLFLKKPEYPERTTNHGQATGYSWRSQSTQREPPTMGKQLIIPEEAGIPEENHQPWASNWLFLQKPEYPERTNHGQVTGYSWRSGIPGENHLP